MPLPAAPTDRAAFTEALTHFTMGISDQLNGEYQDALSNFLYASELDPFHEDLYLHIAVMYLHLNDPERAVATIEKLCRTIPDTENGYTWLGLMCQAADQTDRARAAYRKAIQLVPQNPSGYKELAAGYLQDEDLERAILVLERGAQRVDDPAELLQFLGELYLLKASESRNKQGTDEFRALAQKTFEKAVEYSPDQPVLLATLAELYITQNQIESAFPVLKHLSELEPDNLYIKKKLALAYAALNQPAEAAVILEEIARKSVIDPRAYYYLGELYQKTGNKEKAILNFRLATQVDPPAAAPFLQLALLCIDDDKPEEAIDYLKEGLLVVPDDPHLSETLAYLYMNVGNFTEAERYFKKTVRTLQSIDNTTPLDATLLFHYALTAQHNSNFEQAAQLLLDLLEDDPMVISAYGRQAFDRTYKTSAADARTVLTLLLQKDPPQRKVIITTLAMLYSYDDQNDEAVRLFRSVEEEARATDTLNQLTDEFFYLYGAALERLGAYEAAIEQLQQCLSINPDNAQACNYIAYMWAEEAVNLKEAERYIRHALQLEPNNPAYLDTLGWIQYQLGNYRDAETNIQNALLQLPDDYTINEHYGDVLLKLNRPDEALKFWNISLSTHPAPAAVQRKIQTLQGSPSSD